MHFKNKRRKRKRTSKNLLRSIHTAALSRGRGQRRHRCLAHVPSPLSLSRSRNVPAFRRVSARAISTVSWLRTRKRAKARDISNPATMCFSRRPTRNGKKFTIRLTIPVSLGIVVLCDNLNVKFKMRDRLRLPTPSPTHKSNPSTKFSSRSDRSNRVILSSQSHQ